MLATHTPDTTQEGEHVKRVSLDVNFDCHIHLRPREGKKKVTGSLVFLSVLFLVSLGLD